MRELGTTVNIMRGQQAASDKELLNKQFRELLSSVVEIQTRLTKYNQMEETHVYKWVNILLNETERLTLMARMRRELQNLPPRFRSDSERAGLSGK